MDTSITNLMMEDANIAQIIASMTIIVKIILVALTAPQATMSLIKNVNTVASTVSPALPV